MKPNIFFCGEALIDLITNDGVNYRATTGGSPYNAAKAAAMAGAKSYFCGAVSRDIFGTKILADLEQHKVNCSHVVMSDLPTVLGFIQVNEDENPIYTFFDRDSCMINMEPYLPDNVLKSGDILEIGSISLIVSPGANRIEEFAITHSKRTTLALDPNVRPGMIAGHDQWRPRMLRLMRAATIIKISSEDLEFFEPNMSCADFAQSQLKQRTKLIITTDGENGATAWNNLGCVTVRGLKVEGGDTVGAGDTLMGFSLAWLCDHNRTRDDELAKLSNSELQSMLTFANTAAAINCEAIGCNPPNRDQVIKRNKFQ